MKYIHVKIEDAGLMVYRPKYPVMKNYHFDANSPNGYTEDDNILWYNDENLINNPFKLNHLSNMIHVLCGCRPVSTLHNVSGRKRIQEIDDIAKASLYRIENVYYTFDASGGKSLVVSYKQGKTFLEDSNRKSLETGSSSGIVFKGAYITWRYFDKKYKYQQKKSRMYKKYQKMINMIESVSGMSYKEVQKKWTLCNFFCEMGKDDDKRAMLMECAEDKPFHIMLYSFLIDELSSVDTYEKYSKIVNRCRDGISVFFKENFCKVLFELTDCRKYKEYDFSSFYDKLIQSINNISFNNIHSGGERLYNDSILRVRSKVNLRCNLSVDLYIPMTDNRINKAILTGTRCATFLDGGLAEVDGTEYDSDENLESKGYKKIVI